MIAFVFVSVCAYSKSPVMWLPSIIENPLLWAIFNCTKCRTKCQFPLYMLYLFEPSYVVTISDGQKNLARVVAILYMSLNTRWWLYQQSYSPRGQQPCKTWYLLRQKLLLAQTPITLQYTHVIMYGWNMSIS